MSWDGIDGWLGTEHEHELVPMSWDELGGLAGEGWEIGSHTRTHPRLTQVSDEQLADELAGSRSDCERELGGCRSIAYPYGDHDARVVAAARAAGYEAAGTLPARLPRTPRAHAWPRIGIHRLDSMRRFRLKASPTVRRLRASPLGGRISGLRRPPQPTT